MLVEGAVKAFSQILSPPFRRLLSLSLLLTAGILLLVWFGLTRLFNYYLSNHSISGSYPILDTLAFFLVGIGLFVGLAFLLPPVSALVSGYFLDEAAEAVEQRYYPNDVPGTPLSFGRSLLYGLRFAGLSLAVNIVALLLVFVPGVNLIAFFVANGYLLGREYFEMAAARFRPVADAEAMRVRNRATVFLGGLAIAALVVVPFANLLTPLFGIALMVHVHKALSRAEPAGQTQLSRRPAGSEVK
ncbi:sulfate transporter family protein [Chelatococcus reniformis]|uniref:sulfate transporter family protein n=1 Tax=Chelatococcus reniformis TaxID=1494448 RepID=UPI0016655584